MKSYADFMENDAWSCKLQGFGGVVFGLSKPRYSRFEPITPHRKNSSCEQNQGNGLNPTGPGGCSLEDVQNNVHKGIPKVHPTVAHTCVITRAKPL